MAYYCICVCVCVCRTHIPHLYLQCNGRSERIINGQTPRWGIITINTTTPSLGFGVNRLTCRNVKVFNYHVYEVGDITRMGDSAGENAINSREYFHL